MKPDELETISNALHRIADRWRERARGCRDGIACHLFIVAADRSDAACDLFIRAIQSAHRAEHNERTHSEG